MHSGDGRMKTSGLVLDIDDDPRGDVLVEIFGGAEKVPAVVKTAHVLSAADRERLGDHLFALVLVGGDRPLRKYACADAGNTVLSTIYFLRNAHKLPERAQKTAAQNLATASRWYGLAIPAPLEKLALGMLSALTAIPIATGTAKQVKSNMSAVRAMEGPGHAIVTPEMRNQALKMGEASGTPLMPASEPTRPPRSKTVVEKTAGSAAPRTSWSALDGELHPHVDVSALAGPPVPFGEKRAQVYALGDKYPLDSYLQVQAATRYFDEFGADFDPEERATYARALVKRADAIGVPVSDRARKYGSTAYAPLEEIYAARDLRRNALHSSPRERQLLDALYEKRAELSPESFCATLAEFDKLAGLAFDYDRSVPDAFYSTYGFVKNADPGFREVIGNDVVTGEDLHHLGRTGRKTLEATFNTAFVDEFGRDPIGIFKSLPRNEKIRIMRMATDTAPGELG